MGISFGNIGIVGCSFSYNYDGCEDLDLDIEIFEIYYKWINIIILINYNNIKYMYLKYLNQYIISFKKE